MNRAVLGHLSKKKGLITFSELSELLRKREEAIYNIGFENGINAERMEKKTAYKEFQEEIYILQEKIKVLQKDRKRKKADYEY